uniref:Uncharacterized protein n=1 Tax=uncultured prokaryote TaxID=198431 RepID=A0A0H5Q2A7_9ZZZZ|nr:hypothetical protein [uncultured prokaryote]
MVPKTQKILVPETQNRWHTVSMALAPVRHPQRDFFILDIADVVPKDDTASMEHPLFSLATKPDMRELRYRNGEADLHITPSGIGLPTIFDKDILIFCISQLMHLKNQGQPIGNVVRFSARDLLEATNRRSDGTAYPQLEDAFRRLIGTTFKTSIRTGNAAETRIFSLVDEGGFTYRWEGGKQRRGICEVVLSDWLMRAIDAAEVVTISNDYFRIRRPLERRIYELARKHCGQQPRWQIGLEKLQQKTGSNAPLKRFRLNVRQIIEEDSTPDYTIELTTTDQVIFKPRRGRKKLTAAISIPTWAEDQAREVARSKGWDYHALEREFRDWASSKPEPQKGYGAAFVGFCKKKPALR